MRVFEPFKVPKKEKAQRDPSLERRDVMIVRIPDKTAKECEDSYRNSQLILTFIGETSSDWHLQEYQQSMTLDVGAGFFDLLCNPPERFKQDTLFTAWIPVFMPVEIHRSFDGISVNFH